MPEPQTKSRNTGLIIGLVVGLVLLVPCVALVGLAVVGGGMAFLLGSSSERGVQKIEIEAMPPPVVVPEEPVPPVQDEPVDPK
jgi:hypothetical protein